jgi:hypothetical protein
MPIPYWVGEELAGRIGESLCSRARRRADLNRELESEKLEQVMRLKAVAVRGG